MLSIIYTYRDRELQRIKNSLNSLEKQSLSEFEVFFVDYGSQPAMAKAVEKLCETYTFVNYNYCFTQFQPWNKSRALNSVIKKLQDGFCFIADIDLIFHPDFVKNAIALQVGVKSIYFQVGFLEQKESLENKNFSDFHNYRKSTFEATGLSMFPLKVLQELRGFDEFYHFWGAEDTDMHVRLKNAGYKVEFYDKEILMLHQWHPSYRSSETTKLGTKLQLGGIARFNHEHLRFNREQQVTQVNFTGWGHCHSNENFEKLNELPVTFQLSNKQWEIEHLLFHTLSNFEKPLKIQIKTDEFQNSGKYLAKKLAGKGVPKYYNLKHINDLLLRHIISFYRHRDYYYKILPSSNSIEFAMNINQS